MNLNAQNDQLMSNVLAMLFDLKGKKIFMKVSISFFYVRKCDSSNVSKVLTMVMIINAVGIFLILSITNIRIFS